MEKREYVYTENGERIPVATREETAELIAETARKVFRQGLQELEEEEKREQNNRKE